MSLYYCHYWFGPVGRRKPVTDCEKKLGRKSEVKIVFQNFGNDPLILRNDNNTHVFAARAGV